MLEEQIEQLLIKTAKKTKTLQFAMSLPAQEINYTYSNTILNQQFHSASIGKLMTATLIYLAIEQEKIRIDTQVLNILDPKLLDRLFVYDGIDYKKEVTVRHLLGHLSGINDYFESETFDGAIFTDGLINNPNKFWKPTDLLDYTRNQQNAISKPDQKFFYSDTGYILLGLIIEKVFGMPFHEALQKHIFEPSDMDETSLCFYSKRFDPQKLAPLYINNVDVHLYKSLSCDFFGWWVINHHQ